MVIRTWRILHTFLCFFSYWQKLLHFWLYEKAFLEDWRLNVIAEWSMFGSSFHLASFLDTEAFVGWAEWHSQLDLDRQLLITWWPLKLLSWNLFELHRWFQLNKVVPTRNLSSDWSGSLSLYPQHLEAKKQQQYFSFFLFSSFSLHLNRSSVGRSLLFREVSLGQNGVSRIMNTQHTRGHVLMKSPDMSGTGSHAHN